MALVVFTETQLKDQHAWALHVIRRDRVVLPDLIEDRQFLGYAIEGITGGKSDEDILRGLRSPFIFKDGCVFSTKQIRRLRAILPGAVRFTGACTRVRPDGALEVVPPLFVTGSVLEAIEHAWIASVGPTLTLPRLVNDYQAFATISTLHMNDYTFEAIAEALRQEGVAGVSAQEVHRVVTQLVKAHLIWDRADTIGRRKWARLGRARRATSSDVQRSSALVATSLVRHAFPPIDSSGLARIAHQTATGLGFASVRDLAASVALAAALSASASSSTPPSAGIA